MRVRYFLGFGTVLSGLIVAVFGQDFFNHKGFYVGVLVSFLGMMMLMRGKRENKNRRTSGSAAGVEPDSAGQSKRGESRRSNQGGSDEAGANNSSGKDSDDGGAGDGGDGD